MFTENRTGELEFEEKEKDKVSKEYSTSYSNSADIELNIANNVLNFLEKNDVYYDDVLEIGCGQAQISKIIKQKYSGATYTGVEISADLYKSLNAEEQTSIVHATNLYEALSKVANYSKDLIIMHHVLEHMPNPKEDIECILKKLKPKGYLFIEVPNEQWKKPLINVRRFLKRSGDDWFPGHVNFFTKETLQKFMAHFQLDSLVLKKISAAEHPNLVIKMLGGAQAFEGNALAKVVLKFLILSKAEKIIRYGVVLRYILRAPD